jgi:hypothetical protein
MHLNSYVLDGEDILVSKETKRTGSPSNASGTIAVTPGRVVFTGAKNEVVDISLDGIVAAEYTKQSPWNQWVAGGLLTVVLGYLTLMIVGNVPYLPEIISTMGVLLILSGLVMAAYGLFFRKWVLMLHTAKETYEFKSQTGLDGMTHQIRRARSQL